MRLLVLLLFSFLIAGQTAEQPVVQAILFYSPTCPYCHKVINELLIPMQEQYGDQLQVLGIDTSHPAGSDLYRRAVERFEIPDHRIGVPTLIIGDTVLVGSGEIPAQFPTLVEHALSAGGIGWPDISDLAVTIPDLPPSAGPGGDPEIVVPATAGLEGFPRDPEQGSAPADVADVSEAMGKETVGTSVVVPTAIPLVQSLENTDTDQITWESEIPPVDTVGFGLATLVLIGMVIALIYTARLIIRPSLITAARQSIAYNMSWTVPTLAMIGLIVALYLSYVEVVQVEAICGPVGECNIVQFSPYARLMGIPVAVLGMLSYIAIVILWIGARYLPDRFSARSMLGLFTLAIVGTGFSIYLTALELFVIRAVCAWCLSSAVVTTLILVLVIKSVNKGSRQVELGTQT